MLALLTGCASEGEVRGRLDYDLRPMESRRQVNWPRLPDTPRFRYVGELIGEPNFIDTTDQNVSLLVKTAILAGKWIAGLMTTNEKMLMIRPIHGMTDAAGRVLVVDAGRNAILVFEPQAKEAKKGDGELLIWSQAEEYKPFQSPIAIVPVWKDRLAVSDAKLKAVFLLDGKGAPVGQIGMGSLERPTGLAFDATRGHLYVADTEAGNIKVYAEDGSLLKTIGSPGSAAGELNAPTHLAYAGDRLHVSDTLNNRIQVFNAAGEYQRAIGEAGVYVGQLTRPKGVAVSEHSKLTYVVESYFAHLLVFDEQGQFLMGIDGSGLIDGKFMLPAGIWLGDDGKVFVADMYNNRVVIFEYLETDD
jgi:DNA-binding beta-propeller fold protein YncE